MKRLATFTAISAAILMTFCLVGFSQNAPIAPPGPGGAPGGAPGAQAPGGGGPGGAPAAQEKTFEGKLTKVDDKAKLITVKGADDKEMSFSYNDATQMTGVDKGPAGLTGKTGSNLKITYRENRGANLASKIEVEGGAAPAPRGGAPTK
jgi:hypothetical protein